MAQTIEGQIADRLTELTERDLRGSIAGFRSALTATLLTEHGEERLLETGEAKAKDLALRLLLGQDTEDYATQEWMSFLRTCALGFELQTRPNGDDAGEDEHADR